MNPDMNPDHNTYACSKFSHQQYPLQGVDTNGRRGSFGSIDGATGQVLPSTHVPHEGATVMASSSHQGGGLYDQNHTGATNSIPGVSNYENQNSIPSNTGDLHQQSQQQFVGKVQPGQQPQQQQQQMYQ